MLRSGASRSIFRSLNAATNPALRATSSPIRQQLRSQLCTVSHRPQPLSNAKPLAFQTVSLVRRQSGHGDRKPVDEINAQMETELGKEHLESHPETVSASSSTHPLMSEIGAGPSTTKKGGSEDETEMLGGIKTDLVSSGFIVGRVCRRCVLIVILQQTIFDTFSLKDVPRQAYWVGMAGVLPYLATSLSTVYCSWEIHHAHETGSGLLMSDKSAELLLHIIEPLQIGYGAVVSTFHITCACLHATLT